MLFSLGISTEEAREAGILFVGILAVASWPPAGLDDLALVDWSVVAAQLPSILGVVLVMPIYTVLNASAVELATGAEMDMNRNFRAEGAACLVASLGGRPPAATTPPSP